MNWMPLYHVLVRYVDDPLLYRQRLVLRSLGGDFVLVTLDREVQEMELVAGLVY